MAEHVLVRAKSVQGNIQNVCWKIPMQIWSHDGAKYNVISLYLELLLEGIHVLMSIQEVKKSDTALLCHRIKSHKSRNCKQWFNKYRGSNSLDGTGVIWVSRR